MNSIYHIFQHKMNNNNYLQEGFILAPTLDVVKSINNYMMSLNSKDRCTYFSFDRSCMSDSNFYFHTPEFFNTLKCSGAPDHEITLKIGTLVILLKNIDHSKGLCNGTRLLITRLRDKIIEAMVLIGSSAGELVLITRLSLTPSDTRLLFKFQCRQFPLIVSYVIHDQMYVAVSRITNRSGLKVLLCNSDNGSCNKTKNIVFHEVFRNL
ncbi:hypothetical protein ACS0TY_022183 [Phlomoides rotata]